MKTGIALFVLILIPGIILFLSGVNIILAMVITFVSVFVIFYIWFLARERKISNIVNIHCDPLKYLEKCSKKYMSFPNMNRSLCYMLLGRYDDAYNLLITLEQKDMPGTAMRAMYHSLLLTCYLEKNNMDKAAEEYTNVVNCRKRNLHPRVAFAIDLNILNYNYKLNSTHDTAKYCLAQIKSLYAVSAKNLTNSQKLAVKFMMAELYEKLEDMENAVKHYRDVADKGNTLFIAQKAREKVDEYSADENNLHAPSFNKF